MYYSNSLSVTSSIALLSFTQSPLLLILIPILTSVFVLKFQSPQMCQTCTIIPIVSC